MMWQIPPKKTKGVSDMLLLSIVTKTAVRVKEVVDADPRVAVVYIAQISDISTGNTTKV